MAEPVISVVGLRKSYGELEAVRGIDLEVGVGEIFAFLGPNGAGKTTTVEILEGYRRRTAGEVTVLGADPARVDREWRERIGIVLQESKMHPELTVRESLELFAGYYRSPREVAGTIDLTGLTEKAEDRVGRLSGGQQRRLDVALALIGDPELLFLDEPTTGFDPSARRRAWDVVASLRDLGKTVFLTTHYMEEAQALADRVAIIAHGQIVAQGPPGELAGRGDATARISFRLPAGVASADLPEKLGAAVGNGEVRLEADDPVPVLHELTAWALERRIPLTELEVRRPSLEDVYLELTAGEREEKAEE
ncbi:MAG: ABC transporter ATP-binding protein [Actinomycetota bacterium]